MPKTKVQVLADELWHAIEEDTGAEPSKSLLERTFAEFRDHAILQETDIETLKERAKTLREAIGLATTAVPDMVMQPDDPIGMMHKVVARVRYLIQELTVAKEAVFGDPCPRHQNVSSYMAGVRNWRESQTNHCYGCWLDAYTTSRRVDESSDEENPQTRGDA